MHFSFLPRVLYVLFILTYQANNTNYKSTMKFKAPLLLLLYLTICPFNTWTLLPVIIF